MGELAQTLFQYSILLVLLLLGVALVMYVAGVILLFWQHRPGEPSQGNPFLLAWMLPLALPFTIFHLSEDLGGIKSAALLLLLMIGAVGFHALSASWGLICCSSLTVGAILIFTLGAIAVANEHPKEFEK